MSTGVMLIIIGMVQTLTFIVGVLVGYQIRGAKQTGDKDE